MLMEVCKIVEGQELNERQMITVFRKLTCKQPRDDREKDILMTVQTNAYADDPCAKEFGFKINETTLARVEARILPAPWLKYHDKDCLPEGGRWNNMSNNIMVNGGKVENWICINFSSEVQVHAATTFLTRLVLTCRDFGMDFKQTPVIPIEVYQDDPVKRDLKTKLAKIRGMKLDLLIVILPDDNGSLYGDLKRICETELGIVSQCCLTKNVLETSNCFLSSISLKINAKVGGRNTVLVDALSHRLPVVGDDLTIIFGADVTHPQHGDRLRPSIAAVVASQDWPEMTKYASLVSAQAHRQELIQNLYNENTGGMIGELLSSFKLANGELPKRIIFYRDGVSDTQFDQVRHFELSAIKKACEFLGWNYKPLVTFVVVQKRHHTRWSFADDHTDSKAVDGIGSGNILPGTVVDSKICHTTELDFYLCSHAGVEGTSCRPAHYHVLWDENKFPADGLQSLT